MPVRRGSKGHNLVTTGRKVYERDPRTDLRYLCNIYQCTTCGTEGTRRTLTRSGALVCRKSRNEMTPGEKEIVTPDALRAAGIL